MEPAPPDAFGVNVCAQLTRLSRASHVTFFRFPPTRPPLQILLLLSCAALVSSLSPLLLSLYVGPILSCLPASSLASIPPFSAPSVACL